MTCPKCDHEFVATVEPDEDAEPAKKAKKPGKPAARNEDDEEDAPRKKKKKKQAEAKSNKLPLIIGGGVLAIGGVVGLVLALGSGKKPDTAKADPNQTGTQQPAGGGMVPPGGGMVPPGGGTVPPAGGTGPFVVVPGGTTPGGGTVPPNGGGTVPPKQDPPRKDPPKQDPQSGPKLPDPPIIKISGSSLPTGKLESVEKPPAVPPLLPEEDPFVRAKQFRLDSPLPTLPKLPPAAQRPLLTLDPAGHSAFVKKVFLTRGGDKVITVGEDKSVRVWDIRTGDPLQTIRLPAGATDEGKLQAAGLSADGKRLAVAGRPLKAKGQGAPVFLINVETGALIKTLNATHGEFVSALDFSNDGNRLVVGTDNGWLQLFTIATGGTVDAVPAHGDQVIEVRFNPNPAAKVLATIGYDRSVRIWNLADRSKNVAIQTKGLGPNDIDWSADGQTLAVACESGDIVFCGTDGRIIKTLDKHSEKITLGDLSRTEVVAMKRVRFMPNGAEVACCGNAGASGWAGIKSVNDGKVRVSHRLHTNLLTALAVSADGTRVVSSGGNQHESYVWDPADGKIVNRLCGSGNGMWGVGWARDGKSIAYGTSNIVRADGGRDLDFTFRFDDFGPGPSADEGKYEQALASDGTYACKKVGDTLLIGPLTRKPIEFVHPDGDRIYSATVLPGRRMVVVAAAFSLLLVDPENGKVLRRFAGHTGNVFSVAPSPDGKYFVTGSNDQTIRIWLPALEDPMMSLFIGGKDWICWTPEGFYACSGNGERLVAWQVNNGSLKFPQVHPAERFRPSMYQPALIKYLIPAGSMPLALAMATKFDNALVKTTNVADVLPPEVTLISPDIEKTDVVIDQETFTVKASAQGSAKYPITGMRLLVDGRPYQGAGSVKKFDNPQPTGEATWEVSLVPGPHSFAVIAESPVSKGMTKTGVITRSGTPPKPNLYVLAIGISAYPEGMKLNFCASDASLLAKTFREKSKDVFGTMEIHELTDAKATKQGIRNALDQMKAKMKPTDIGIVSFSGHGMRDPLTGKFYLVTVDVKADDPEGTCFSGDEFKSRLENMPGRLVAILDACHSGTVAEKSRPVARTDGLVRDLVSEDSGVIVMCASLGREYAIESTATKAGFFTLGLVEGMGGLADIDSDGVVYIHELDVYASARVKQLSGGKQNPTLGRPPGIRPFPIAKP